jgi:hypothetical protein
MAHDVSLIQQCQALVNLGPWLDLAQQAGIAYIAAKFSESFPVAQLYDACTLIEQHRYAELPDRLPELNEANYWLSTNHAQAEAEGRKLIARWECCTSDDMKWRMSKGEGWSEHLTKLTLDDSRLYDGLAGEAVRLCVRPWVEPLRIGGYPVEFRVFYGGDGAREGVSSYYPQRPLPDNAAMRYLVSLVSSDAELLRLQSSFPVGFTADFLVSENLEVLFLEGGPPHIPGGPVSAHPCCFSPGQVRGVALAAMEGAVR